MYIYDVENPICLSCFGARSKRLRGCAGRLDGEITGDGVIEEMSTHGCAQDEKATSLHGGHYDADAMCWKP